MAIIVLGTKWGDEGKGKPVDILAAKADLCIRAQGATMQATQS
jgi:adenylosuccinate synthase